MKAKHLGIIAAVLLSLSACGNKNGNDGGYDPLTMSRDSLQQALANQDSLLVLMSEITNDMNQIKSLENILASPANLQSETVDRRQQIKDDMMAIQRTLNDRRQRLAELESRLNKSNANNAHLKQAISALKDQIAEQEQTIEGLRKDLASANIYIEQLTQNVDSLSSAIAESTQENIEVKQENTELTNELNTCYYAIGSKSELQAHKILQSGFLRKTKIMPADFEMNYFTKADKRTLKSLPLHSKKAKVITNQPTNSYEITTDANGSKTLVILDPEAFWTVSNFLAIQID